jgi:rfaE bifunctional protein kinase chain/domain
MTTEQILHAAPGKRILVVGDICLDRWCTYAPDLAEPSRETGLARTAVIATEVTPGAAGTVANNLKALGVGLVSVLGVIGDDGHGLELKRALVRGGIDASLLVEAAGATFTYTKLINQKTMLEDLGRLDFISLPPPPDVELEVVRRLELCLAEYDAILVADQMETALGGAVTAGVRDALIRAGRSGAGKLIWVDSRLRIEKFAGLVLKPNQREANEACARLGLSAGDYGGLREATSSPLLVVTHGGAGITLAAPGGISTVETTPHTAPVDVTGAGDSFSAGMVLALSAGASPVRAARFGHLVGSVTVMKPGTGTASPAEVLAAERMATIQ